MEEYSTLEGTVHSIIFQNPDNGYTVLRLLTDEGEVVNTVGCLPCAAPGERMLLTGRMEVHPQHGEQFSVRDAERRMPAEEDEILSYLSSGAIKGVGPATAARMVERFGSETLDVIEREPEKLAQLKGLTSKRAMEIAQSFRSQMELRRLMEFLARFELPIVLAMLLEKRYGGTALDVLRENPYLLAGEAFGVEFSTADEIAISLGIPADSACRVEAAVLFELDHNADNGHVFLPREKLIDATARLLDCGCEQVEQALDGLVERCAVVQEQVANVTACYLRRLYDAECYAQRKIELLLSAAADQGGGVEELIGRIEEEQGISYAPAQRQAVELAAREGVLLLTGGPGTGKTTSVRGIVALFRRMGLDTVLAAPTGRAAKRMGELCGMEAQTIHRLLGMSFSESTGEATFIKGEKEPLEADAVIVDEMSMVDLMLMAALLRSLRPGCRLVMVGDPDQLSAVGAGNVFSDLIRSGRIATVALREIFRQAERSAIVRNAHAVNEGRLPALDNGQEDFFFLRRRDPVRTADTIVELVQTRLPEKMGVPVEQIQVLTPTHKGEAGTVNLNRVLQAALNPRRPDRRERSWGERLFREGDRIMQTKNDYDVVWEKPDGTVGTGMFNGDVGRIEQIDPSGEWLTVNFDDRLATYTADQLSEIDLAYAMTVHKAQGSEYRCVVLAAVNAAPALMVRGVLYTAITRARELLILVGDETAVGRMTENDRQQKRYSGLKWRLRGGKRS
ncbi:ATP-dependent RecD-like DNA helicase [Oscillibacter hominis]|uniref:ATP-dependent RecD2 DNA helicase n=1 Tax=Oscillibacter hominis TaxID=2763056 RepID=A0A7G9B4G1_9FIRM|nr:ATP-dependent RecD-like DNA helicase [Oscillibacter hominis]QNL44442.1 ATP-dependent RecD-like DNA helicase [Oscillibacter hominis]